MTTASINVARLAEIDRLAERQAAPDGFEDEQPLVPRPDGSFGVGDDPRGPENLRSDTIVDGRPLRAWLSGFPYYRTG